MENIFGSKTLLRKIKGLRRLYNADVLCEILVAKEGFGIRKAKPELDEPDDEDDEEEPYFPFSKKADNYLRRCNKNKQPKYKKPTFLG